ncbi:hypothetical protein CERSUDRAFT_116506 [Gelatoporia subvermispora B]|uniref:Importin-13 n=1 Tax=Ceriporiopsis subvermispora (strain B) TaxID=914234 RepID=M2PG85_CERS8|nr:hypothetical protein CERSUDRAFT_116506 [Gelatoporia subvermispora B]
MATTFLPALPQSAIEGAVHVIQQAYAPQTLVSSEDQRRLQQQLFEIQKQWEAWGLVIPFLEHADPNVQFFGAHTAQVKIARDWATFPQEHATRLRDMMLEITSRAIASGRNKVILRKLFVAITALALKIYPTDPSLWPDWLLSTVHILSNRGASGEHLLDFLAIVAEEVETADLLGPSKAEMQASLQSATPMVRQAIATCIAAPRPHHSPSELSSALKCLQAWLLTFPASDLTPLLPVLMSLLDPIPMDGSLVFEETSFVAASDTLQEIMTKSAFSDGSGRKTLTEPVLLWMNRYGDMIIKETTQNGFVDAVSHSFCKLIAALGDHSTMYLATNVSSTNSADPQPPQPQPLPSQGQLVQTFLRQILAYTSLPGFYGVDEEESELTLGFWYLYQEALWNSEYDQDLDDNTGENRVVQDMTLTKGLYFELVRALRRKAVWPPKNVLARWTRDQIDKFQTYRRDVGDTLINAYYLLRDDMLGYLVTDAAERLDGMQDKQGWEEVEATLHCIMALQEAIPIEDDPNLKRLFGSDILGRLPTRGNDRVRRTALLLIGEYASWFTTQPVQPPGSSVPSLLLNAISFLVPALTEPALCLPAANSLRGICDANRTALAPHIGAFGELHARLPNIPDTEKSKVLQSIASVIQALPPEEEIAPIEVIVNPVLAKLFEALQSSGQLPEEARVVVIQQLETIAGVARGLTRTTDSLLVLDDLPEVQHGSEPMKEARNDSRVVALRDAILRGIRTVIELWSTDALVSDALSELIKAITSLPSDVTLLSLSPGPLLEIVCMAAQRQLTAVWLSLATMLIIQFDPPSLLPSTFKPVPDDAAQDIVLNVLVVLLQTCLNAFTTPGAMEANPDIMQAFFNCMDTVAQHFVAVFYRLPADLFNALVQSAIASLSLQERYSLVAACTFVGALINRTATKDELEDAKNALAQTYGLSIMKAVLNGFAGIAPRSATPNLIELLSTLVTRFPAESRKWVQEVLYSNDFTPSKATPEAKEKFVKTIFGSRSLKRTREAAQQFTLVARGLEGSSFGYSSVMM